MANLAVFNRARERLAPHTTRTPLLPFEAGSPRSLRLKAENLQPLGSFKVRAAFNALLGADAHSLQRGAATASAGNFAQGLALAASRRGVALTVHVPDTAAEVKRTALAALGATVVVHPFDRWWTILTTRTSGRDDGRFFHPVSDPQVIVGNGVIGLEILDDWPEVDTIAVPIGGGGLAAGIALAVRASGRSVRIVGCEIETAAPLSAAFAAGRPVEVERRASFVDGIGSSRVLDEMWPLLRTLIDEVVVVSVDEAKAAVRDLALRSHLVVEGAGAVALAAAQRLANGRTAVVLSGGNIDPSVFCGIVSEA